ncbi:MAG: deoxyguanosinetriphosphate triphosphohydrolase, partial [Gluconacetobacter diazotrophicus]|nr:deoxyguanosinetriphosphate triphosphohydrolase [Gluconacetobacter diazotrophicus]
YHRRPDGFFSGMSAAAVADLQTFEGNAQGFRLLTALSEQAGLRLTYATLGSFIKYPWSSTEASSLKPGKFSFFRSESAAFETIVASMGLLPLAPGVWCRHPLAYLVEAADDICYAIIDIEDGVEMGLLHMRDAEELLLSFLPPSTRAGYDEHHRPSRTDRQRLRWLRGRAVDILIEDCVDAFFAALDPILEGRFPSTLVETAEPRTAIGIAGAKALARTRIFTHTRKMEIEVGAYASVDTLLDACSYAVRELLQPDRSRADAELSYRASRILGLMGDSAPSPTTSIEAGYRLVNDFLSGLTDNRATELARVIRGRD